MRIGVWLAAARRHILGPHLGLVCRVALGVVFVIAGWNKIGNNGELAQSILDFAILPGYLVRPFALTLPWIELLSGALLIVGLLVPSASALLGILNVGFLSAIGVALFRGTPVDCGCFGHPEPASWTTFARAFGLLLLSLQVLAARQDFFNLDGTLAALLRRWLSKRSDRRLVLAKHDGDSGGGKSGDLNRNV